MKKIIGWALLLLIFSTDVYAKPKARLSKESCYRFVQDYYDWYLKSGQSNFEKAIKNRKEVFSSKLLQKMNADLAASAKSPQEIVGLDFDPILNSQDPDSKYIADEVEVKDKVCKAPVSRKSAKKGESPDVTAELQFEAKRWVFVNFHYKGDKNQKDANLLTMLDELAKLRTEKPVLSD